MVQLKVVKHEITNVLELKVDDNSQRKVTMISSHDRFTGFTSSIKIVFWSKEYSDPVKHSDCGEAIKKDLTDSEKPSFKWWKNSSDESVCEWGLVKAHTTHDMNKRFARVTKVIERYLNKK